MIAEFRYMIQQYSQSGGTVQRLLTDPSLYNNANESALMIARMMPRLERTLANIEVFSDKIARHPGELGIRGAIKPDGGLKGAPTSNSKYFEQR